MDRAAPGGGKKERRDLSHPARNAPESQHASSCAARPAGAVLLARSQARHRYQLATDPNGFQRNPRLNTTSGFGKSAASSARVFGTRMNVSAYPLRTP